MTIRIEVRCEHDGCPAAFSAIPMANLLPMIDGSGWLWALSRDTATGETFIDGAWCPQHEPGRFRVSFGFKGFEVQS